MIISRRDFVVFIFTFSVVHHFRFVQALLFIWDVRWGCSCSRFDGLFCSIKSQNSCVLKYFSFPLSRSLSPSHTLSLSPFLASEFRVDSDHSFYFVGFGIGFGTVRFKMLPQPPATANYLQSNIWLWATKRSKISCSFNNYKSHIEKRWSGRKRAFWVFGHIK